MKIDIDDDEIGIKIGRTIEIIVQRIIDDLIEEGYNEAELNGNIPTLISDFVISEVKDAINYYFEGEELTDVKNQIKNNKDFNKEITNNKEYMVEEIETVIVPQDKISNYDYKDIVVDMESEKLPFTKENIEKMIKEKYKL